MGTTAVDMDLVEDGDDTVVTLSDVDKTNFITFFPTVRGDRTFFDHIEAMSGDAIGTGGAVTIVDSSWKVGFVLYNKYFPGQPDDVNVFWAYGPVTDVPGDFIKRPMRSRVQSRWSRTSWVAAHSMLQQ
jgi:myosin-crossreactive antigen